MNWGNAIVKEITKAQDTGIISAVTMELHLTGDVRKTAKKITWLSTAQKLVSIELVDFDYLITKDKLDEDDNYEDFLTEQTEFRTKALADENVAKLLKGSIIQFDRKGYFILDQAFQEGASAVFFNVPTGKK
jgi:glutamyl-tRNA synthetase